MTTRSQTRTFMVGNVPMGGGAPVSVQTMANADPHNLETLLAQVIRCAAAGADIVRLTVPDLEAARVLGEVRKHCAVPLVADIHFDWRLAIAALENGADALRINPGNIGSPDKVRAVAQAAAARKTPIRIGVNGGSLEADIRAKYNGATADALVESALRHVALLEAEGFRDIAISVKASDVPRTLAAYRRLAEATDCPLHLGVTEAGTFLPGTVRSSVALGILLAEGIGDTIRVSLTDTPEKEVRVGLEILRSLGMREGGVAVTSCPTCGRTKADVFKTAEAVESALENFYRANPLRKHLHVAVMGCAVNGPGEAKGADVALCGGKGEFILFVNGEAQEKMPEADACNAVIRAVDALTA
ncbi:MAG: flavodoxin-dependent (E)-4-hydroxy-3-methylbut-2-enyl-diphosphate synthase [Kiritimatiellae bacterium]|nr:flavodoxin-dependent (E)-4-hydroxy-3-methylbut-2-enyl-diphosphate synthase [Kiritimatiellia bacterium]